MMSRGEKRIAKILEREGLNYKRERAFSDCKGYRGRVLRFDFYIEHPELGWVLLEYHGQQHYKFIPYFHKKERKFLYQRQIDTRKCSYALAHDIPMFVIPFIEYENLETTKDLFKDKFRVHSRQHAIINNPIK